MTHGAENDALVEALTQALVADEPNPDEVLTTEARNIAAFIMPTVRALMAQAWDEGWEASRSESGLFCSRAGGCLPPGMNEQERYNQNPYPSARPIPPVEECQRRPHYGDPCDCEARLALVVTHTRTSTPLGPDYCAECSEAISEWVPWPCGIRPIPPASQGEGL